MIIDGFPDMMPCSSCTEGKAELSAGERSRSSVGSDGLSGSAAGMDAWVSGEDNIRSVACPSELF